MRLLNKLLSRVEMKEFYPSKQKKEKKPVVYFHQSNVFFEKKDEDGVVRTYRVGLTYRKPKE